MTDRRADSASLQDRVLTLCFHGIGEPRRDLELGEERFWISEARYHRILDAIMIHPRRVDITFDDSNESDFTLGLPALKERGLMAEFFIIAGRIGTQGSLTGNQIVALRDAGMTIGSHGMWHKRWSSLRTEQEIQEEIVESAQHLQRLVGVPIQHAALPNGAYNRVSLQAARRAGYRRVYTVDEGTSRASSWLRSRYSIHRGDTRSTITARLDNPDGPSLQAWKRSAKGMVKRWR